MNIRLTDRKTGADTSKLRMTNFNKTIGICLHNVSVNWLTDNAKTCATRRNTL